MTSCQVRDDMSNTGRAVDGRTERKTTIVIIIIIILGRVTAAVTRYPKSTQRGNEATCVNKTRARISYRHVN